MKQDWLEGHCKRSRCMHTMAIFVYMYVQWVIPAVIKTVHTSNPEPCVTEKPLAVPMWPHFDPQATFDPHCVTPGRRLMAIMCAMPCADFSNSTPPTCACVPLPSTPYPWFIMSYSVIIVHCFLFIVNHPMSCKQHPTGMCMCVCQFQATSSSSASVLGT